MSKCYLCDHFKVKATFTIHTDRCRVECPSCGEYTISESVRSAIANRPGWGEQKLLLAKAARRNFDANTVLELNTEDDWLEALRAEAAKSQG